MILTRAQVLQAASAVGIPTATEGILAPDEVEGKAFASVAPAWVSAVYQSWLDSLPANLKAIHQVGGGMRVIVPRYILNGFCCRGASLSAYAHGMLLFAMQAAAQAAPLDHDALAFGFLHYVAQPRAANSYRNGPHEKLWFIDDGGKFQTFEEGDGDTEPLTPAEYASVTLFFAQ